MSKREKREKQGRIQAVLEEGKKIRWVRLPELASGFVKAVVFMGVFALFFTVCDLLSAVILKGLG